MRCEVEIKKQKVVEGKKRTRGIMLQVLGREIL